MKYQIALGTTSASKRKYLEKELDELGLRYTILTLNVSSGVSDQPMTDEETRCGSINRAKKAFELASNCDLGIGIEAGYHKNGNGYDIFCWVTIKDKSEKYYSEKSEHICLPDFHSRKLKEGEYLANHVKTYIDKAETEEERQLGIIIDTREPFIREAIRRSLNNYINNCRV